MAKMIDKEPKYEGEKIVWHSFSDKLPSDWVIYNTRSINGREYDFCVISPNMGLFIVEVKGWKPNGILNVIDANTILLAGVENPEDSPRGQARGYRFDLRKKIQRELGMNPLVMSFVCYPCISEDEYYAKGLNVVSEANETIFKEELSDSVKL
ncbi:MAG: nuclease-related domain-containing protein [Oscillospiraceae bacterium]|nr:nuclease-related domain-containing protein [Oscillospiraceae bacterium]